MTFDEKIKKLDEITSKIEKQANLSIDDSLNLFVEGSDIIKQCYDELNEVKGKVTIIKQELDKYTEENM